MAQIKKIVKPGDLIRGAKVGVAGLDKDGNVIGTGIDTEDIATFPEGAQSGDVLAWGGDTGAEWRPPYPENGSEGDVLTLGETGPEWAPPSGGGSTLYKHNISVHSTSSPYLSFSSVIISSSSAKMNAQAVREYIKTNHPRTTASPRRHPMPCTCTVSASDGSLFISSMIEYTDDSDSVLSGMSVNLTNNTMSSGETLIAWSRFNDIVDIVTEI